MYLITPAFFDADPVVRSLRLEQHHNTTRIAVYHDRPQDISCWRGMHCVYQGGQDISLVKGTLLICMEAKGKQDHRRRTFLLESFCAALS